MKVHHYLMLSGTVGLVVAGALAAAQQITVRKESAAIKGGSVVMTRTYRGDKCVLWEMDRRGKKSRGFRVNGKVVAVESEQDANGVFRELTIFDPSTGDFERFTRSTNGSVVPLDSAKLEAEKKMKSDADQALAEFLKANTN